MISFLYSTPILLRYTAQKECSASIPKALVQEIPPTLYIPKLFGQRALKCTYKRIFLLDKHFGLITLSYVNIMHKHYRANIRKIAFPIYRD